MENVTKKGAMQPLDTYFNKGALLVKKIIRGEATRKDINNFASQISFDLKMGAMTEVLPKYVALKNLGTLLKAIETEMQPYATDEAECLTEMERANVLNARISIKEPKMEYDFDDPRWLKLQTQINNIEAFIEEKKLELANLKEEQQILGIILASEGLQGSSIDLTKTTIVVTLK